VGDGDHGGAAADRRRALPHHRRTPRTRARRALGRGLRSNAPRARASREFSVVEAWSGHFHPTDPTGTKPLDLGSARDNDRADVHREATRVLARLHALPTLIAFYVGKRDSRFAAENELLNRELTREHVQHVFSLYEGGHDQALWGRHAPAWLALALAHLAPAR
jgi:enterochelin esterase-like enzyme